MLFYSLIYEAIRIYRLPDGQSILKVKTFTDDLVSQTSYLISCILLLSIYRVFQCIKS